METIVIKDLDLAAYLYLMTKDDFVGLEENPNYPRKLYFIFNDTEGVEVYSNSYLKGEAVDNILNYVNAKNALKNMMAQMRPHRN